MNVALNGSISEATRSTAARGLSTVALLKANYDKGRDHIGLFQPFLLDTIFQRQAADFSVEEIKGELHQRHQLKIPAHSLKTLLDRAKKNGAVKREGGRYFRSKDYDSSRSGRPDEIALIGPPTPPDMRFSASGGWIGEGLARKLPG